MSSECSGDPREGPRGPIQVSDVPWYTNGNILVNSTTYDYTNKRGGGYFDSLVWVQDHVVYQLVY